MACRLCNNRVRDAWILSKRYLATPQFLLSTLIYVIAVNLHVSECFSLETEDIHMYCNCVLGIVLVVDFFFAKDSTCHQITTAKQTCMRTQLETTRKTHGKEVLQKGP